MTSKIITPQFPTEFVEDPNYYVIFATNRLMMGRMIGESKSTYKEEHREDLVIFNANIVTESKGKIWFGDLNINLDFDNLKNVADALEEDLYILMESDARFGCENDPINKLIGRARTIIKCNKK